MVIHATTNHASFNSHDAVQMNQRQLWFLGQMQQGYKCMPETWWIYGMSMPKRLNGMLQDYWGRN